MRKFLIALAIAGGLAGLGSVTAASAAPASGAATVGAATSDPAVEQVYWWRGRWVAGPWRPRAGCPYWNGGRCWAYAWGGRYWGHRAWRGGVWVYY